VLLLLLLSGVEGARALLMLGAAECCNKHHCDCRCCCNWRCGERERPAASPSGGDTTDTRALSLWRTRSWRQEVEHDERLEESIGAYGVGGVEEYDEGTTRSGGVAVLAAAVLLPSRRYSLALSPRTQRPHKHNHAHRLDKRPRNTHGRN